MKFQDINKRFTEKVTDYINNGYIINTPSMAGSQGEIGKVDLVKGAELIRIWLNNESSWNDENGFYGNKIVLRVSKWSKEYDPRTTETVWMSELNHIEENIYYEIGRFRNKWYLDNLDEALACIKIHDERRTETWYSSYDLVDITNDKTKEIAVNYLKNHKDYQRVSRDKIRVIKRVYHEEGVIPEYLVKYNDTQVYKLK